MLGKGGGKLTTSLLRQINAQRVGGGARHAAGAAVAEKPKKVEVFIDDKKVLVEPGMTILQVRTCSYAIDKHPMPLSFVEDKEIRVLIRVVQRNFELLQ